MPEERQRFWLFSVARILLNVHYRRQAMRARFEVRDAHEIPSEYRDPAAQEHVDRDTTLDLGAAISRLPEELCTVLAMSLAGGMTSTEIGEALGRPPGTVRYQLAQARSQIAMMLGLACTPDEPQRAKVTR
jgi:RNA polymerase sigma factor (sigma-70 family)